MNNRRTRETENLLAESFHGDWATGPAAKFASRAAAHARRRRTIRAAVAASGVVTAIAATLMVALLLPGTPANDEHPMADRPAPSPAYEIISDDELLAVLRDRPLLVVHAADGSREIVLLEN